MCSEDVKHTLDSTTSKHLFATTVKLNDSNYLRWVQSFCLFVGLHKKQKHVTDDPPTKGTTAYDG